VLAGDGTLPVVNHPRQILIGSHGVVDRADRQQFLVGQGVCLGEFTVPPKLIQRSEGGGHRAEQTQQAQVGDRSLKKMSTADMTAAASPASAAVGPATTGPSVSLCGLAVPPDLVVESLSQIETVAVRE